MKTHILNIALLFILTSCTEYEKEKYDFIQQILKNPKELKQIIINNKYYHPENFKFYTNDFKPFNKSISEECIGYAQKHIIENFSDSTKIEVTKDTYEEIKEGARNNAQPIRTHRIVLTNT